MVDSIYTEQGLIMMKAKREELNLLDKNVYLVEILGGDKCIIHIREMRNQSFIYRIISTKKGMELNIVRDYEAFYIDTKMKIISKLNINTKRDHLDGYADVKRVIASMFPEYFI